VLTAIATKGNTTTLTFAAPWHHVFRVSHAADLARIGSTGKFYSGIGIEDLTVANGGGGDGGGNIAYWALSDSWIKNVESYNANGSAIHFSGCFRCELRDSYVHTAGNPNPGGGGYGIAIDTYTSDSLVENTISWSFNKVMVMRGAGGGNVIGYNYFEDGYGAGYYGCPASGTDPQGGHPYTATCDGIPEAGMNATHMAGTQYALFEGNQSFNIAADGTWGNSTYITFFRNHATSIRRNVNNGTGKDTGNNTAGSDAPCSTFSCFGPVVQLADSMGRDAIGLTNHQWWYSYVGNVIGYPSSYLQNPKIGYAYPATFSPQPESSTWFYEWNGVHNNGAAPGQNPGTYWISTLWILGNGNGNQPDAPSTLPGAGKQTVLNTLLRDGNFDYVTGKTHWMGSDNICNAPGDAACSATNHGNICTDQNLCAGQYATPPTASALPKSLYIPASMQPPPFFNGSAWPWVDGTNAANPLPGTLPARMRFDAGSPNTVPVAAKPAAPTGLSAKAGNATVSLTWTASKGATTYNVYRGTKAGSESATPIATGITATSYTDKTVTNGDEYYYKVAALSSAGASGLSSEASAAPQAPPAAPTSLTATPGNAFVELNWSASSGAVSYNVYRGTKAGSESATPIATGIGVTAYTDTRLTNGQRYYYEVAAVNKGGTSPKSDETSATPSASAMYALPPDRITAWNPGLNSVGGVPSATWPICSATTKPLAPLGDNKDDTSRINAAIQACPVGSVVQLGTGTFLIDPENQGNNFVFVNKGVVLRGAGAGKTILDNPNNIPTTTTNNVNGNAADPYPLIIVGPGEWVNPDGDARCQGLTAYQTQYMQLLSANGVKGSSSVTVADASIFKAGQFVLLDQASGASWQPDIARNSTYVWASPPDYAVQWQVHKPALGGDDPVATGVTPSAANNYAGSGNGSDAACWFSRQDRPQNEMKQIESVSGNTITFTSPLTMHYLTAQHAELTTYTGGNLPVTYAGVEKMTLKGGGSGAVEFANTAYSWAKNIEVMNWYGDGVGILSSFRDELRDSYIHDASWAEPGGAGYAISLSGGSSEILIENNISMVTNKVMVARSSAAGSVVGYNYMDDGYIATDEGWIEIGLNASHMVGSHHVLFEGNQSFNMDSDDTHGNSTHLTYFRNYATTMRRTFKSGYTGDTIDDAASVNIGPKRAAGALTYSYWMNWVGNVLGESGVTTAANGYVDDETQTGVWNAEIWLLGWNDDPPYTVDPNVASTAIRDGNWDWFLAKQTWLTIPAAAGEAIPDSLYLIKAPAFFEGYTWPWVDPVTGTTYTLPAKARFDAGTPNTVP
jgi:hypothetical protein